MSADLWGTYFLSMSDPQVWLGYAVHALLPLGWGGKVTIVGVHAVFTFDHFGLRINNWTMLIHDRVKDPLRMRYIHDHVTKHHCPGNITLQCRQVTVPSHLGNSGRQYGTACEVRPMNASCRSASVELRNEFFRERDHFNRTASQEAYCAPEMQQRAGMSTLENSVQP